MSYLFAGVAPMSTVPYYPQDFSSGEPEQFRCLGTKTNFAVVHGFGRIIFQSFPILESQGTNLILEVCNRLSIPHCSSLINLVLFLFYLSSAYIERWIFIWRRRIRNRLTASTFRWITLTAIRVSIYYLDWRR